MLGSDQVPDSRRQGARGVRGPLGIDAAAGPYPRRSERPRYFHHRASDRAIPTGGRPLGVVAAAGVNARRRVICYDAAGMGACKLAFALALLGHQDVAV